ncbi:MAG: hypothetical protein IPM24_27615 [Bryobacterales bacterium]|nr:hypothetical protein [Bryobacterales bacterium]
MTRRAAACLVLAWYAFANFPGTYVTATPGLDPSWQYALNVIHGSEWRFGRDIGFTYGPLGFLMEPRAVGDNLALALALEGVLHLLAVAALAVWIRAGHLWRVAAFAVGHSVFLSFGIWREYGLISILGLFALTARYGLPGWRFWALCAGVLAGAGLFMKITFGLAAVSILGLIVVMERRLAAWTAAGWSAATAAAVIWNFSSTADFLDWLRMGWDISAYYGEAMSLPGNTRVLGLAAAAMAALASLAGSRPLRMAILPFLPSLALSFKHGFMRQDGHTVAFFGYATAVCALLLLAAARKRDTVHLAAVCCFCTLLTLANSAWFLSFPPVTADGTLRHLTGAAGVDRLRAAWDLAGTHETLVAGMEREIAPRRLPAAWRTMILRDGGSVTSLPWEITEIHADRLPWHPIPTVQLYSAYSEPLDRRTADFFASPDRPRFIVLETMAVDGRALFLDTPQTMLALLQHYELAASGSARLLLRSRTQPLIADETPLEVLRTRWGQPVAVEAPQGLERWRVQTEPAPFGRLMRLLFRWQPLSLTVRHRSGRVAPVRILPATASGGYLFPALPQSAADFEDLLAGTISDPVESFTFEPPLLPLFNPEIAIERSTAPVRAQFAAEETAPVLENVRAIAEGGMEYSLSAEVTGGSRAVRHVQFLVNTGLDGAGACYVSFDKAAGRLSLMADSGSGGAGTVTPGMEETAVNSACALDGLLSSVEREGERLRVVARVRFFPEFAGTKRLFATADLKSWHEAPNIGMEPGECVTEADLPWPEREDPPRVLHLIFNQRLDGAGTCYLQYDMVRGKFTLAGDSGRQCRIPLAETRIQRSAEGWKFEAPIEWLAGFPTPRRVFYRGDSSVWRTTRAGQRCAAP